MDVFQIVENNNGETSLLKEEKSAPHTVVEVFYLDENYVTNFQNMIFDNIPEAMNPGWFWQRMDVEAIHGPFANKEAALSDFENNFDISYRLKQESALTNEDKEANNTDQDFFHTM